MLIASRGSRSGQLSHGPGGIAASSPRAIATQCRRYCCSAFDLGLTADGSVTGHDRVGELADHVEHVGPRGGIALERERRHAEEAEVAGEQHVDVGDEHHHVAVGVAVGGQQLDARRELGGVGHEVRDRPRPDLGELVELVVEGGHERLVGDERHLAVEEVAGLLRADHRRVRERASSRRRGRCARG